jgi:superfamily II DNA/RNA helicase
MTFEELNLSAPILKALSRCGHRNPTPVQAAAIPKVLAGHDLVASAQTGTGKTAAFVLPALQRLSEASPDSKSGPRVLVLTPTRELAGQITQCARDYGKYLRVHSVAIYGGMPFGDQLRALSQSPQMVIATPGRLIDLIWRGRIDLSQVEMFVLDEADRMLDMGFVDDVQFVSEAVPGGCQTLLFAATMGDSTTGLAKKLLKNPERVDACAGKITHDTIEQRLHLADNLQHKNNMLRSLCEDTTMTRAIIFSATKRDADTLARDLNQLGYSAAALHGDMTQFARNRTVANLRRGKIRLLVATDVAARGLDINGISHVINFDLPRSAEDYVNRIGRTGRAGKTGIAISFASRADLEYLDRIEGYLGRNLSVEVIPGLEPKHPITANRARRNGSGQARANGTRNGRPAPRGRTSDARTSRPQGKSPHKAASTAAQQDRAPAARRGSRKPRPAGSTGKGKPKIFM